MWTSPNLELIDGAEDGVGTNAMRWTPCATDTPPDASQIEQIARIFDVPEWMLRDPLKVPRGRFRWWPMLGRGRERSL